MFSGSSRWQLWLSLALVVVVIILFIALVDLQTTYQLLLGADGAVLLLAAAALIAGYGLLAVRWRTLLGNRPSWTQSFHSVNLGNLANTLTPLPGDPVRILVISTTPTVSVAMSTSTAIVERLLEQLLRLAAFGGMLYLGLGIEVSARLTSASMLIVGIGFFSLVLLGHYAERISPALSTAITRIPGLGKELARRLVIDLMQGFLTAGKPRQLLIAGAQSVVIWAFFLGYHFLVLRAFDAPLSFEQSLALALASLAIVPPSAPAMPGVYQATIVAPLSVLGDIDPALLTAYAVALYIIQGLCLLVLGIWGLTRTQFNTAELMASAVEE